LCLIVGLFSGCIAPVTIKHIGSSKITTPYGEMRGHWHFSS
jgi:hypothetical protein